MSFTNRQRVFVEEYLQCWNATEAARRAGYSDRTARSIGSENLTKPDISAEIKIRLAEKQMSADEALTLLADQARGDIGEFMNITSAGFVIDLINEDGSRKNTRLIKKIKQKVTTYLAKNESSEDREIIETEIELQDQQAALDKLLRVHGKYKDSVEQAGEIILRVVRSNGTDDRSTRAASEAVGDKE